VFNLVNGYGPTVGEAISGRPDIDMVSFTGSTRAGILVPKAAASSVKRVTQELGGKSANIILMDADLGKAVPAGVLRASPIPVSPAKHRVACWFTALSVMPRSP
jgi:aldehyde dehydrogenase (NAD+)